MSGGQGDLLGNRWVLLGFVLTTHLLAWVSGPAAQWLASQGRLWGSSGDGQNDTPSRHIFGLLPDPYLLSP